MSLVDDKRVHVKKVVEIKDKCKLILSDNVVNQINFMHKTVRQNIEWSAILIYDTVEGSVEDPKNWVIKVEQIVPMDVGTSGYTEYEFNPEDPLVDIWMDAMEAGKKIGHNHSHHSMSCFFSGTDMSELHDNSEKHNYYLSLIVNYKNYTNWCAKVAIVGSQEMKGEIEITTTKRGINGEETTTKIEVLNDVDHYMYTIDCNIQLESPSAVVTTEFAERVTELNKPKAVVFTPNGNFTPGYRSSLGLGKPTAEEEMWQKSLFPNEEKNLKKEDGTGLTGTELDLDELGISENKGKVIFNATDKEVLEKDEVNMWDAFGTSGRSAEMYSSAKVKPFLCKLLTQGVNDDVDITEIFTRFQKTHLSDLLALQDWIEDHYEKLLMEHFMRTTKGAVQRQIDCHAVAVSIMDIVKPLQRFAFYDMLDQVLEPYILDNRTIDLDITCRLTGLEAGEIFNLI
jgi:proteasome lid subunit RPN8/RPN11